MGSTSGQSPLEYSAGPILEHKEANNIEIGEEREEESSHGYAASDNRKEMLIE
jgi:hypothetical protein